MNGRAPIWHGYWITVMQSGLAIAGIATREMDFGVVTFGPTLPNGPQTERAKAGLAET